MAKKAQGSQVLGCQDEGLMQAAGRGVQIPDVWPEPPTQKADHAQGSILGSESPSYFARAGASRNFHPVQQIAARRKRLAYKEAEEILRPQSREFFHKKKPFKQQKVATG